MAARVSFRSANDRAPDSRTAFYRRLHEWYARAYWTDNDGTDLCRPNGFPRLPEVVYTLFAEQVTQSGRILDLGCGNGLMLKYVVSRSPHALIPYGVDLMPESIAQARQIVLPEFADNFSVGNVADYAFADSPYEYIFVGPDDLYPQDLEAIVGAVTRACAVGGRVIFYCYRDVLSSNDLAWVGEIPPLSRLGPRRIDRPEVSLGVFEKSDGGQDV